MKSPNDSKTAAANEKLAIDGGTPVRTEPIPLEFPGVHYMDEEEVEAAVRVVRSRSLFRYYGVALGKETEAFEAEFAAFLGVNHVIAVNSGTGALHLSLTALGVGPGQEVIIPAYLWVTVAAAVVNLGAIPVLGDIDETFCLDPAAVETAITPRTTGIIVVHMSGAPANITALVSLARRRGLFVLEDCAQCAGGSVGGRKVGTFGDMGIYSFQMNKNMTSGEGGAIVTNDARLYDRAFASHDTGYARDKKGRAIFDNMDLCLWGRGYRMDELRAAILRVQLRKLPRIVSAMHSSKYKFREALSGYPRVRLRKIVDTAGDTGCFLIFSFETPAAAIEVNRALRAEGIVTYPQGMNDVVMTSFGLHLYYNIPSLVNKTSVDKRGTPWKLAENKASTTTYKKGTCPVADSLFERSILLSVPSNLTPKDDEDILHALHKVLSRHG